MDERMAKGKRHSAKAPVVVVALPFAYREGVDEYNGVMRYLRESGEEWNLRIIRHSFGVELFRGFSEVQDVGQHAEIRKLLQCHVLSAPLGKRVFVRVYCTLFHGETQKFSFRAAAAARKFTGDGARVLR